MRTPISVGVVGLDATGTELGRAFADLPHAELSWVCDERPEVLIEVRRRFPYARSTSHVEDLLDDEAVDVIALAGPEPARPRLARLALDYEKHVFAPGLVTRTAAEVDDLIHVAELRDRRVLLGPVLLFEPGIRVLHELLELGRLGELYYVRSVRNDVAPQNGCDVLWSLGCDAAAVLLTVLGDEPIDVSARAESFRYEGIADMVSCHFRFATGIAGQLYLSSMEAQAEYRLVAVGEAATAVFDAHKRVRRLSIFERRIHQDRGDAVRAPYLEDRHALTDACDHFLDAVGQPGMYRVVGNRETSAAISLAESAQRSIEADGRLELVGHTSPVPVPGAGSPVIQLPLKRTSP